jgi:hypothetical protein
VPLPWRERIALARLLLRLGVAIALLPFAIDWRRRGPACPQRAAAGRCGTVII